MRTSKASPGAAKPVPAPACRICKATDKLTAFCDSCLGGAALSVSIVRALLNATPTAVYSLKVAPVAGSVVCIPGRGALVGSKWMRGLVAESDGQAKFAVIWLNGETATYTLGGKAAGNGEEKG